MNPPSDLRAAFEDVLSDVPTGRLAQEVERLIANYRGDTPTDQPILRGGLDVVAYAAYRMPATYAAVRFALGQLQRSAADWAPATHVDVGGGTGAASWAVADAWPGLHRQTVLDWSEPALELGRRLARSADRPALRGASWQRRVIGPGLSLPDADLVTVSYVLGELTAAGREAVVAEAAARGRVVLVVEPGTPAGYERVREARDRLLAAGLTVLAPCPHDGACPIVAGRDWCHFAVRVNRSAVHRQLKGASLSYEDEKFSYVAACRTPVPARAAADAAPAADASTAPAAGPAGRVLRHPTIRKGMVGLRLCTAEEGIRPVNVTKRHGQLYREARDLAWGECWPPVGGVPVEGVPVEGVPEDAAGRAGDTGTLGRLGETRPVGETGRVGGGGATPTVPGQRGPAD
ncbi:small ribosomal subunit Rsm22 family protein [Allostreptomyces psammosilenae]|uniref:Ribosomal protein RSM22 (Predicted rRNA methylase) n=1 Tax=Allostreptomyces psammosilenae TaxID=1892865 RepID=A0A852ZYH9_9ACTN|nr:small ribosomal subunit Rsm22 family protein [Allostreptomyces psammosilenae]NYI06867.1 ribosomal protein RSM22 (predicted rRNA methylase) [Allostreptomyces psammosilenae]